MPDASPVAVVTGANSGIGEATAAGIAARGYRVIMACRNLVKGDAAAARIQSRLPGAKLDVLEVDLAEPGSILDFGRAVRKQTKVVDVLVNNAGLWQLTRETNSEGHELTFAVNHLGTYRATAAMMPLIRAAPAGRIVTLASAAHNYARLRLDDLNYESRKFNGHRAYGNSKLCNILFTRTLAERLKDTNETANCVHPGTGGTGLTREFPGFVTSALKIFAKSPERLARTSIYAATSKDVMEQNGVYLFNESVKKPSKQARDPALAAALWAKTVEMTGIDLMASPK